MTACIVCGSDDWEALWNILLRCRNCGFVRAADLPTPMAAAEIYTEAYFSGEEYGNYLADRQVHGKNFAARWRDMLRLAGSISSVFEIGCAYGLFLEHASAMRTIGRHRRLRGAVRHAAAVLGQQAVAGDFLTAPIARGEYEAYCLWDTIEHLPHPEAVVERIVELLPTDGWLFLTTGDIGSRLARLRGRRWRMIHPPSHLQYFSRSTMAQFLARRGLSLVEVKSVGVYRTVRSVLSSMIALRKGIVQAAASGMSRFVPTALQQHLGTWVNLGDIMFVAAQKRDADSIALTSRTAASSGRGS